MKIRKTAAIFLAILLAAMAALTGCGGGSAGKTPEPTPVDLPDGSNWTMRTEKMTQAEADQDAAPAESSFVTITTNCGDIQGVQKNGYREFRGVRYATAKRFAKPELVTSWRGTYDATKWGPRSLQFLGFYNMADSAVSQFYLDDANFQWKATYDEDSLNLNIFTPDGAEKYPVVVYIHGGAYHNGSNTDISTDGEAFAAHGVVTVAINYRLNAFHQVVGDGYEGNLALEDQSAAIHWVHDNIAAFGGDPSKITIMGESAGASSVQNLLISPLIEDGLISGAIMMSGGGSLGGVAGLMDNAKAAEDTWKAAKEKLGVSKIQDLRSVLAKEVYAAWATSGGEARPVVNQTNLTKNVLAAFDDGSIKNVPVMIGVLEEDMYPYSLYGAARGYAMQQSALKDAKPVYLYFFDRQVDDKFGAYHAADLYYAFGTLYRGSRDYDATDYRISNDMVDYFTNFIKFGDPNGGSLATWTPATADSLKFMEFGDKACNMMEPDADLLSKNQENNPIFPSASAVGGGKEAHSPISPEEIIGDWVITGWNSLATGDFTGVDYKAVFRFDGVNRDYLVNDLVNNTRTYTWLNEYEMSCVDSAGDELITTIYWGDDNCLLIEDPRYSIAYTCYRVQEAIGVDALCDGEWIITGWNIPATGEFQGIDNAIFDFEPDQVTYYLNGAVQSQSPCVYDEEAGTLSFDNGLVWTYYLDGGKLMIEDPSYMIVYVCVRPDDYEGPAGGGQSGSTELPGKAVTAAQVKGKWEILGWTVDADGSWSALSGPKQYYTFDGTKMDYDMGDGQVLSSAYTVGDGGVELTDWAMTWPGYMNDKNQLCLKDGRYGITYVCAFVEAVSGGGQQSGGQQGGQSQSGGQQSGGQSQSGSGSQSSGKAVTAAQIKGKWKILGWTVDADGSWAPLDPPQYYSFDGTTMLYDMGGGQTLTTAYTVGADGGVALADWSLTWPGSMNDKNQLCLKDGRYDITYVCEFVEAVSDGSLSGGGQQSGGESQSGGQSSSGSQSSGTDWASTLVGSWKLYAWSLGDGSSYTEVANDEFVFSADRVVYNSNGAFQNESTWAVSNNDTGELACERVDGTGQFVWVAKWGDNGVLLIDQPMGSYSIVYYCTKK